MLTKEDLKSVEEVVDRKLKPVKDGVTSLKIDVGVLKNDVSGLKKDMKVVKRDAAQTRKDIKVIISLFDNDYVNLRQRVERIEDHLKLPPIN